jgi:hypothetical protein
MESHGALGASALLVRSGDEGIDHLVHLLLHPAGSDAIGILGLGLLDEGEQVVPPLAEDGEGSERAAAV